MEVWIPWKLGYGESVVEVSRLHYTRFEIELVDIL